MRRQPLRAAALSALAACMAGCAGTAGDTPTKTATAAPKPGTAQAPAAASTPAAAPLQTTDNVNDELQQAQTLRAQGKVSEAIHALAQLVPVAPDDPRIVGEYGKALVQQGRPDDAIAFLKRATELKQDDWSLYSALGVAYDQTDDRKSAKAAYERALALRPSDPSVLNNYAVSRMLAGDYDQAQRLLQQAQATGSHDPKIADNLQLLAQMRARNGVPSAAKSAGSTAVAGAPKAIVPTATGTGATVVMQQVPSDAAAGSVHKAKPPRKIVAASKSKAVKTASQKPALPALRTAD